MRKYSSDYYIVVPDTKIQMVILPKKIKSNITLVHQNSSYDGDSGDGVMAW